MRHEQDIQYLIPTTPLATLPKDWPVVSPGSSVFYLFPGRTDPDDALSPAQLQFVLNFARSLPNPPETISEVTPRLREMFNYKALARDWSLVADIAMLSRQHDTAYQAVVDMRKLAADLIRTSADATDRLRDIETRLRGTIF